MSCGISNAQNRILRLKRNLLSLLFLGHGDTTGSGHPEAGRERTHAALISSRALHEEPRMVTLDQHSGDWVVLPPSERFAVIRLKAHHLTTENIARLLLALL